MMKDVIRHKSAFIAAGTLTQAMLTDPNTFIRNHIAGAKISATTVISIATQPAAPLSGDGAPITSTSDGASANIAGPRKYIGRMVRIERDSSILHVIGVVNGVSAR